MSMVSRRAFASGLMALPAVAASEGAAARPAAAQAVVPSVARLRIGSVEVMALSDGFIDAPYAQFTGAPAGEIEALLAARLAARPSGVRLGFTVWLVDDGERLVLIDTGGGGAFGPTSGRLTAALAALEVAPEAIDAVAITHMHADHVGGLVAGGVAAFPRAEVIVAAADVAHFTDPVLAAGAPEFLKSSFQAAGRVAELYPKLQRIDGERAITDAIATVDLAGHTPGHTGYRITSGGASLLIVGDALFDPALHPQRSDLGIAFEADPAAAAAMRRRLFPQAAEERALLAATHMPFPGIGRIVRDGGGLRWLAADWEYAT